MPRSLKKFGGLWGLAISLSCTLAGWQFFDAQFEIEKPSIFNFLDRHWLGVKQSLQQNWSPVKMRASSKVQLLELELSYRSRIWMDEALQEGLTKKLLQYPGPIVANLDPNELISSKYLKALLDHPNFIRPYSEQEGDTGPKTAEVIAARALPQPEPTFLSRFVRLEPSSPDYYEPPALFGNLFYTQDVATAAAQFVSTYPLALQASRYYLPSIGLSAMKAVHLCTAFKLIRKKRVACLLESGQQIEWSNPLDLFFYKNDFLTLSKIEELEPSSKILIVNIIDSSSYISSYDGKRLTWGRLVATAISNMLENHSPWSSTRLDLLELCLFGALASLMLLIAWNARALTCFAAAIGVLVAYLGIDILLSLFWNTRTTPIEEFTALFFLALTGIGTRVKLDFEDRNLMERALTGYVSGDRLKRLLKRKEQLDLSGRMRQMTTLLLDIEGFSKISEELGPERVFAFVKKFFSAIDPIIFANGGTIDKKTGDGLLAFFGDYEEKDDPKLAALSAVRSAVQIQNWIAKIQNDDPLVFGLRRKIDIRIGVNSGPIMIGNTGSSKHFNYTVLGATVNFTQRLEAACPRGRILIGSETRNLVFSEIQTQEIAIPVKGETDLYRAHLVEI
ncbi:MAG: hypothetical protein COV44_05060 [Deltaproteobacteria bacterium CG11_big_fil_rev_8_21_14_0_20_45_16]|nr:MAG: hypothetical protein COV44_05060 [Deltaproteobacteria bacterium CG11_big_fil_rev_8_21_14_0_20_45_16]